MESKMGEKTISELTEQAGLGGFAIGFLVMG